MFLDLNQHSTIGREGEENIHQTKAPSYELFKLRSENLKVIYQPCLPLTCGQSLF